MTADQSLDDAFFAALATRSRATNLARVGGLTALLQGWQRTGTADPTEHRQVAQLAHQVVGSAGTFGFDEVSSLGRQLEELMERTPQPNPEQLAEWLALANSMERGLNA